jgi:hypothetical protein
MNSAMDDHYRRVHGYGLCTYCALKLPAANLEEHKTLCPMRPIQCRTCYLQVQHRALRDHLHEHAITLMNENKELTRCINENTEKLNAIYQQQTGFM